MSAWQTVPFAFAVLDRVLTPHLCGSRLPTTRQPTVDDRQTQAGKLSTDVSGPRISGTVEGAAVGRKIARGSQLRQQLDDLVFEVVCRLWIGRRIQLLGHD